MLTSTVVNLTKCIGFLKKGNFREAANAVGLQLSNRKHKTLRTMYKKDQSLALANGWLQLQYGWLPLLSDTAGMAEKLAAYSIDEVRTKASALVRRTSSVALTTRLSSYPHNRIDTVTTEYTVKYDVIFAVDVKSSHTLSSLGLTNPVGIAWELLPWSFAIDWFLPVGDFIATWDATLGLTFKVGSVTTFERTTSMTHAFATGADGGLTFYDYDVTASKELIENRRTPLFSFPIPGTPSFKNPLSVGHCLNALALLRQMVKK